MEMKEIRGLLTEARRAIDGSMNCHTGEYAALDALERAVSALADRMQQGERAAFAAANTASCLANGIQPD